MDERPFTIVTPRIVYADAYPGYAAPEVNVSGDLGGTRFRQAAALEFPNLLYLFEHPGGEGAFTHIVIDVWSKHFTSFQNHGWEFEVSVQMDDAPVAGRLYQKCYGRHQFLIPVEAFRKPSNHVTISARPIRVGSLANGEILFDIDVCLAAKPRLWNTLARSAIWVFSTARSGSTWLAVDVLCAEGRARPIDESGVGRMFAPLRWDAERFFDPQAHPYHLASGFDLETGQVKRGGAALPVFQRGFTNMALENQILSRQNFELYHRLLRDVALEHVINEWGILGFSRVALKMPNDSHAADFIMRAFPESHMVFMLRDGRDVLKSRFSPFASPELATTGDRGLRRYAIAFYAHFWNFQIDIIRSAFEAHAEARRYLVRYEEMRQSPVEVIGRLYRHLGYTISEEQLVRLADATQLENVPAATRGPDKPRQTGEIGGYRTVFDADEIALMTSIMAPNLARYGYAV